MNLMQQLNRQAEYNIWINSKLYDVCAGIPDSDRKQDMGAFFNSIHGTLNHNLLGDRLWLGRFRNEPFQVDSLAQEMYSDFSQLRVEREITDKAICDWVSSLSDHDIESTVAFTAVSTGKHLTYKLADAVLGFFYHQVHHRGQLTALISRLGIDYGQTDLIWMPGLALKNE